MLLFRSEEHVTRWCEAWRLGPGATLRLGQCYRLAEAWYSADRRDPLWRRRNPDETLQLFNDLGLTDAFWRLQ